MKVTSVADLSATNTKIRQQSEHTQSGISFTVHGNSVDEIKTALV